MTILGTVPLVGPSTTIRTPIDLRSSCNPRIVLSGQLLADRMGGALQVSKSGTSYNKILMQD